MSQRAVILKENPSNLAICSNKDPATLINQLESSAWTRAKLLPTSDLPRPRVKLKKHLSAGTFSQPTTIFQAPSPQSSQLLLKQSPCNRVIGPTVQEISTNNLINKECRNGASPNSTDCVSTHGRIFLSNDVQKNPIRARSLARRASYVNTDDVSEQIIQRLEQFISGQICTTSRTLEQQPSKGHNLMGHEPCLNGNYISTRPRRPKTTSSRLNNPSHSEVLSIQPIPNRPQGTTDVSEQHDSTYILAQDSEHITADKRHKYGNQCRDTIRVNLQPSPTFRVSQRRSSPLTSGLLQSTASVSRKGSSNQSQETTALSEQPVSTGILFQRQGGSLTVRLPQRKDAINTPLSPQQSQHTVRVREQCTPRSVVSKRRSPLSTCLPDQGTLGTNVQLVQETTRDSEQFPSTRVASQKRRSTVRNNNALTAFTETQLHSIQPQITEYANTSPVLTKRRPRRIISNTESASNGQLLQRGVSNNMESSQSPIMSAGGLHHEITYIKKQSSLTDTNLQKPSFEKLFFNRPEKISRINGRCVSRNLQQRTEAAKKHIHSTINIPHTISMNADTSNGFRNASSPKDKSDSTRYFLQRRVSFREQSPSEESLHSENSNDTLAELNRLQNAASFNNQSVLKHSDYPSTVPFVRQRFPKERIVRTSVALRTLASKYGCSSGEKTQNVLPGSPQPKSMSFNKQSPKINIFRRVVSPDMKQFSNQFENTQRANSQPTSTHNILQFGTTSSKSKSQVESDDMLLSSTISDDTESANRRYVSLDKLSQRICSYWDNTPSECLNNRRDTSRLSSPSDAETTGSDNYQSTSASNLDVPQLDDEQPQHGPSCSSLELREDVIKTLRMSKRHSNIHKNMHKSHTNTQLAWPRRPSDRSASPTRRRPKSCLLTERADVIGRPLCRPETAEYSKELSDLTCSLLRAVSPKKLRPTTSVPTHQNADLLKGILRPAKTSTNVLSPMLRFRPRTSLPRKLRPETCSTAQRADLTQKLFYSSRPKTTICSKTPPVTPNRSKTPTLNKQRPTHTGSQRTASPSGKRPIAHNVHSTSSLATQRPSTTSVYQRAVSVSKMRPPTNSAKHRANILKTKFASAGSGPKRTVSILKKRPSTSSVPHYATLNVKQRPSTTCIEQLESLLDKKYPSATNVTVQMSNNQQPPSNPSRETQRAKDKSGTQCSHSPRNCLSWEYPQYHRPRRHTDSLTRPNSKRHQHAPKGPAITIRNFLQNKIFHTQAELKDKLPLNQANSVDVQNSPTRLQGKGSSNGSSERTRAGRLRTDHLNMQRLATGKPSPRATSTRVQPPPSRSQSENTAKPSVLPEPKNWVCKRTRDITLEPAFMRSLRRRASRLKAELVSLRKLCEKVAGIIDTDLSPECTQ